MKYFLDTEFIEDGKTIDLISIAVVCEDGREFYAESSSCVLSKANPWVKENVIPSLWSRKSDKSEFNRWSRDGGAGGLMDLDFIAIDLRRFCICDPEFWGYYADYDWIVLCQIFGTMMDLPKGWPMYCRDLKQEADRLNVDLAKEIPHENEHNALYDARWNFKAYKFLEAEK